MKGNKSNFNTWDNQGKGKEHIDANNKSNQRPKEGGRAAKNNDIAKTLKGMKPRPKR